jgi:hypothetical protein
MKVRADGLTRDEIEVIAGSLLMEVREHDMRGKFHKFILRPLDETAWRYRSSRGRKVHAICYHGFAAFLLKVYESFPHATVITMFSRYNDSQDFRDKYKLIENDNVGSLFNPVERGDACGCDEDTVIDIDNQIAMF